MSDQNMNNAEQNAQETAKQKTAAQRAQSAKQKYDKTKNLWNKAKSIKSLTPVVTAVSWILIVLLIFIIAIGFVAFFLTMPGLMIDKFIETCQNFWKGLIADETVKVTDEQIVDLANYIEDLGYDMVGYGFATEGSITREGGTEAKKGKVKKIDLNIDEEDARNNILNLNRLIYMNSDSILLSYDNNGDVIYTKDILKSTSILKYGSGNINHYRAVDSDGKNIQFYDNTGNEIGYILSTNGDDMPVFKRVYNAKEIGRETISDFDMVMTAISYDDYTRIRNNENIDTEKKKALLRGQKKLIDQLLKVLTVYKYHANDETSIMGMLSIISNKLQVTNTKPNSFSAIAALSTAILENYDAPGEKIIEKLIEDGEDKPGGKLDQLMEYSYNTIETLASIKVELSNDVAKPRPNLFSYILANERTYTARNVNQSGAEAVLHWIPIVGDAVLSADIMELMNKLYPGEYHFGMIVFPDGAWTTEASAKKGNFEVNIDREENAMTITTGGLGPFGTKHQMKWNLAGWTSRYGKPIELSLALHLSTMAPDFVSNFCLNDDLQTQVYMKTKDMDYNVFYSYITAREQTVYKHDTQDVNGEPQDGIVSLYEKIESTQKLRENLRKLFPEQAMNQELKQAGEPIDTEKKIVELNISTGEEIFPVDIFNQTSIISVTNREGQKKYYRAVDQYGEPIRFIKFLPLGSMVNGKIVEEGYYGYRYGVQFDEEGCPRFIEDNTIYNVDTSFMLDYSDLNNRYRSQLCIISGNVIKLECLSFTDFRFLLEYTQEFIPNAREGFFSGDINKPYPYVNYYKYRPTLYVLDELFNELKNADKYKDLCNKCRFDLNLNIITYNLIWSDSNLYQVNPYTHKFNSLTYEANYNHNLIETWDNKIHIEKWLDAFSQQNRKYDESCVTFSRIVYEMHLSLTEETDQIAENQQNYDLIIDILSQNIRAYLKEIGMTWEEFEQLYNIFKKAPDSFNTYQPYIEKVVHHWYKDLYFEDNDGEHTEDGNTYTSYAEKYLGNIDGEYKPDEDTITQMEHIQGELRYTAIPQRNGIKQVSDPIQYTKESWHYMVKNWLRYGYYFIYDGTSKTASEINDARNILQDLYDPKNPLLLDELVVDSQKDQNQEALNSGKSVGSKYLADQIDKRAKFLNNKLKEAGNNARLEKINFEKKSSLTAFSMLEGMHTEDSEYIYRDLKEYLIELGYFTRADFETIETDVFKWIIKGYKVYKDEWPDQQYEINATEYGTFIRSKESLEEQRKDERELKLKKLKDGQTTSSMPIVTNTQSSVGEQYTAKTGVTYNVYYQNLPENAAIPYSQGTIYSSACGATSVAMLMSAYGSTYTEKDVAQYMTEHFPGGETNVDNLRVAIKEIAKLDTTYYAHGEYAHGTPASDNDTVEKVLREAISLGKPAIITRPNHYMLLVGLTESDHVEILNPWLGETNYSNYTLRQFIDNIMDTNIVIPNEVPTGFTGTVNSKKSLEGFKAGLKVIAPENGTIVDFGTIEEETSENGKSNDSGETSEDKEINSMEEIKQKHMKTNGEYVIVKFKTGNGVDGWKMKIEGFERKEGLNISDEIELGAELGKTTDSNMKIILYDDKDAIINDVSDYFKLPTRGKSQDLDRYAFFYYIAYESGHTSIEGNGPEQVGVASAGEYAIGINQWTSMGDMCNIQSVCEKLYNLDRNLCAPLEKYIGIDNNTLISKYLQPNVNDCEMKRDLLSISNNDREAFMELQMQIAESELCGYMDNLGLSWIKERPSVVQGTLASLLNWGPYLGWENVIDDGMDDEEIIIELMKHACTIGSTVGSLANRWNAQAKAAIDILNGVVDAEQFFKVFEVFAPYGSTGSYTNFLSSAYDFTSTNQDYYDFNDNNKPSNINQMPLQNTSLINPESSSYLFSQYDGEYTNNEIIQVLNDLAGTIIPKYYKELRNSSQEQITSAYKDAKNVQELKDKKISISNEATFVNLINDVKKLESETAKTLKVEDINFVGCEIDKNSIVSNEDGVSFKMKAEYPYGEKIELNLSVKNSKDSKGTVIEINK